MFKFPYVKEALSQVFSKPSTERYPFEAKPAPPNYRGRIVFHPERCNNCGLCIRVCAPGAIVRRTEPVEGGEQVEMEFHLDSCAFCQMCADFCNHQAIELSGDYELVASDPQQLIVRSSFFRQRPSHKPVEKAAEKKQP